MKKFIHGEIGESVDWHDIDGNIINVSDGGIIYAEGKYHWYGQALGDLPFAPKGKGGQTTRVGVVMYESCDLLNWKYEGVILGVSNNPQDELYGPMRFERPKIIYNEKTKQYVLWCHYVGYPGDHNQEIGGSEAGVAVCDRVNGSYKWQGTFRPIDDLKSVKDCTLYKDADGSAYFIYDRCGDTDRCLHIVKLTDDYLGCTDDYRRIDVCYEREAPAIVYHNGYYYMFTSGLTGWHFNQAKYFRAKELMGDWEDMGDPCIDDETETTFNSQSTYIFKVEGKEDMYIHMAERHNTDNFLHCSYIWLPINFHDDHTLDIKYAKEWTL